MKRKKGRSGIYVIAEFLPTHVPFFYPPPPAYPLLSFNPHLSLSPPLPPPPSVLERGENGAAQERGAAAELTEQNMGLMLLEVCHKPGGAEYLRLIHHIIQVNEVGKHSLFPPQLGGC